jgi:ABC-type phosphate transport system auxiliary subunit
MMEFLLGFVLGAVVSIGAIAGYGFYQLRKLKQVKAKITEEIKKKIDNLDTKRESIRSRLLKAQEITEQQLDLRSQAEMPSKNALHSRYKNGLVGEIRKLEDEKLAVLRSILDDGYDPTIVALDENGQRTELPLSHFIDRATLKQGNSTPASTDLPKRIGKFTLVKGGKDDGTVH